VKAANTEHEKICRFCDATFANKYIARRHMEQRCKQRPTNSGSPQVDPNVTLFDPNVTQIDPNVTQIDPNVTESDPNVTQTDRMDGRDQNQCMMCAKTFSTKSNLVKHNKTCNGVANALQCHKCTTVLTNRQAKYRHLKVCESKELTINNNVNSHNTNNMNAHNIVNGEQHNTYNITINNFGEEDLSHITPEYIDKEIQNFHGKGIANLINDTHFNPLRPQNHNIRINSKKYKTLKVKQDNRWRIKSNDEIMDIIMQRYKDMFIKRMIEEDFPSTLKWREDYKQIEEDLARVDKRDCPQVYYSTIRKILAAMEELELHYANISNGI
jgi:hypothetical protein